MDSPEAGASPVPWISPPPDWPGGLTGTILRCSTRLGGVSRPPYDSLNLGLHVGDEPQAVQANRDRLQSAWDLPGHPLWLHQVHGADLVSHSGDLPPEPPEADGAFTNRPGAVLAVMTADCLPVGLVRLDAPGLILLHCGWKSLAQGLLERSWRDHLRVGRWAAWIGPGISGGCYPVGPEVRAALTGLWPGWQDAFSPVPGLETRWHCALGRGLRARLEAWGLRVITAEACTFSEPDRFFSARRDKVTGRQALLGWIIP